jgi:DNA-nicking Smr family endonuclease
MAKQRKSTSRRSSNSETDGPKPRAAKPAFLSPFKDLKKLLQEHVATRPAPPAAPLRPAPDSRLRLASVSASTQVEEETLFRLAFEGVRPLGAAGPERIAPEPLITRNIVSEDAEVLAELSDLVSGQGTFELTETEEYVEGARVGLDPRLVTRLRRGEFSVQAHLDLHGMTQVDAKEALTQFIVDSVRKGRRAVLVVHGRGLRSPGGQPVLKHAAAQWLSHGTVGGYVLAFATAQAYDGGTGAVWVLLRRERKRAKFDVLQGAKRRD